MNNQKRNREYLLRNYGFDFPERAIYKRQPDRIYFATDFVDKEEVTFAYMCEKSTSNAAGYAVYSSYRNVYRLVNIEELEACATSE